MSLLPAFDSLSLLGFAVLLLWAAWSDIRSLTIPNRVSLGIALLYPIHVLAAPYPVDWTGGLAVGGSLLLVGFIAFSLNLIGGGDAKMVAATGLWAGPTLLFPFLFYTALIGGGLAMLIWLHHRLVRAGSVGMLHLTQAEAGFSKRPMPYAVAIAIAGLYVAFTIISVS